MFDRLALEVKRYTPEVIAGSFNVWAGRDLLVQEWEEGQVGLRKQSTLKHLVVSSVLLYATSFFETALHTACNTQKMSLTSVLWLYNHLKRSGLRGSRNDVDWYFGERNDVHLWLTQFFLCTTSEKRRKEGVVRQLVTTTGTGKERVNFQYQGVDAGNVWWDKLWSHAASHPTWVIL